MRIGLALGSGGAKGYAHMAYLKAIDDLGIEIHHISGTSMGALIGAFYAGGMKAAKMIEILQQFSLFELTKLFDLARMRESGIVRGRRVEKFLAQWLPVVEFEKLKIPLDIVATDYSNKRQMVFNSGPLIPAIRASISIPGIFQPFQYQNKMFIDGGVVNPVPFDLLTPDCDFIICVDVSGEREQDEDRPLRSIELLLGTFQIMQRTIVEQREKHKFVRIYCKPALKGIRALELYKFKEVLEMVAADVEEFKEELLKHRMVKSRIIK